ncbi:MAG: hypothetical protein FWC47_13505 [Oscillospiraceae bacterium]|nr:hypothetical protein [Oscillospiraceae bacterium]
MFIIINGVKQIFRTPIKTILFLLLIATSMAFLSIGVNLWLISERNLQAFENSFTTIGTVEQKPNIMKEGSGWDAGLKEYSYFNYPVYDSLVPVSILDFKGANYIHTPENRPFYGAYSESYVTSEGQKNTKYQWLIVEVEPLETCIPNKPVKIHVKKVLYGFLNFIDEIWFCDHYNDNPQTLYAGKTYVMSLQINPMSTFEGFDGIQAIEYVPAKGITSVQYDKNGVRVSDEVNTTYDGYEEVTEGYYDTPRGQRWKEMIKGIEKYTKTIPVVPTNATNLLMDFYNSNANIIDGRDISKQEYSDGSKVCLIQKQFAKNNGLKVGDFLPLPLYYANYKNSASQYFFANGGGISPLLNAQGKSYPVFENDKYTIVGIYQALGGSFSPSGFDIGMNTVIIPSASVENSDENNISDWGPMRAYNTSFEIPNGTIDKFVEEWNKQGIEGLDIQFYDKGYSQLKDGLDQMRIISVILIIVSAVIMLLVLIFFTFLFIIKNKKRTAVERSLGFSRKKCTVSLLSGMLLLSILGIAIGNIIGYFQSNMVINLITTTGNKEKFSLLYSSWVNSADKVATVEMNFQSAGINVFLSIAFIVLIISIFIASIGVWRNLKHEPIALLSEREDE